MNKVILIKVSLISLWCISCAIAQDRGPPGTLSTSILPIENLSLDNPNHKRIIEWMDNYRQKMSQSSAGYQSTDQSQSSKQDLVNPLSYSSINDAIKLASNQPQQAPGLANVDQTVLPRHYEEILSPNIQNENQKAVLNNNNNNNINNNNINPLLPYAYQTPNPNVQIAPPIIVPPQSNGNNDYSPRLQEPRRIQGKLDPYIQDHIRRLQEQSLADGRQVLVEVKGDDTSDKSLFDSLRPLLHDPSVLDQLKPKLQESKSLLPEQYNPPQPLLENPVLVEYKKPVLQLNKPLLDQTDILEKLRKSLSEQQQQPGLPLNSVPTGQYPQLNGQPITLVQNPVYVNSGNQRQLIEQLEAMAVRPLLLQQYQNQGNPQQPPPAPQQPPQQVVYNQQQPSGNIDIQPQQPPVPQNSEPKLLGQRLRQSATGEQPTIASQSYANSWQSMGPMDERDGKQLSKREQGQYDSNYNYPGDQSEDDPNRKQRSRDQLIRELEEQQRKQKELISFDLRQRRMLAEERHKQEIRDQREAERRLIEKREHSQRIPKPQKIVNTPQINMEMSLPPTAPQSRDYGSEQQWNPPKQWAQNENIVKNKLVNRDRGDRAVEVLHSIQGSDRPDPIINERPREQLDNSWQNRQQNQNNIRQEDNRWVDQPTPSYNQQPRQQQPDNRWVEQPPSAPKRQSQRQPETELRWIEPKSNQQNARTSAENQWKDQPLPITYQDQPQSAQRQTSQPQTEQGWSQVEKTLDNLKQLEKTQTLTQIGRPIEISASALAQAEQSDAEYTKLLREILKSLPPRSQQETRFVPVEPPPTGQALTTTQATGGAPTDRNSGSWWIDNHRSRADRQ